MEEDSSDTRRSDARRKKLFVDLFGEDNPSWKAFETRKKELSQDEIARETRQLWRRLKHESFMSGGRPQSEKKRMVYGIAASLVLLLAAGLTYFFTRPGPDILRYQTSYGETETVTLPDQSVVILNANSTLTYTPDWHRKASREVWLEGEAYFQVKKQLRQQDSMKFIVHTDHLNVEVLGTQFNVKERRGTAEVLLNTGKVKVNFSGEKPLLMKPGELVNYSVNSDTYAVKTVNPETYASWRNHVLTFEDSSLEEIALVLEDTYGYSISFQEATLAKKQFTTTLSSYNVDMLFPMLEEAFNVNVIRDGKKIRIEPVP